MSKIHIVHIIPTLRIGGAEHIVVSLCNNYDQKKYRSTIITFFEDIPLAKELKHTQVIVVPKKGKVSIGLLSSLAKKLKEVQPDIVHTHLFGADVWGRIAARRCGVPVVTTEHNINVSERTIKHLVKRALRRYSAIYIAPSRAIAAYMQQSYHVKKNAIEIIPHGIEMRELNKIRPLQKFSNPVRFVLLGRLVEQKGHTIALEALAELTDINWQLKIVGDGPLKEKLHIYVTKNNIHDRVIFSEATRDITTVFEQTDIVLMPSRWEGFGIVAMEAMAAGRIVIAADTGGLAEIVRASENGYIFEAQNSFDLYNVMHDICMNKKDAISVAKKAQVYAEAHFSMQTMVDMYEKVYEILLNKK